jgi:hypothetical protein
MKKRKDNDAECKASAALEAVKGERTVSQLIPENDVYPTMIH